MHVLNNKVKEKLLSCFYLMASLGIFACSSEPKEAPLPDCNYAAHNTVNEQVRNFIWRDAKHITFHEDWQQSSLIEISNRYQYLQRKALADAVKAENEILSLESRLNDLLVINKGLLKQTGAKTCNNQEAPQSVSVLEQQNAGIVYLLAGLPDIANDIQAKKQQIISAIASK